MIHVYFPTIAMHGGRVEPLNGFYIREGGVSGLDELPDGDSETKKRPQNHGAFDLPLFREARLVVLKGYVYARSEFELDNYIDQFKQVGADGERVTFTVDLEGKSVSVTGRVIASQATRDGRAHNTRWATFSISIECADPRMTGKPNEFAGSSVQVHHYGNFPASPTVEVAGPRTAPYTVTGPGGRRIEASKSVPSGKTDVIDFARGGIFRDGVRQLGAVTWWEPWTTPPGKRITMSISSGSMKVIVPDTYM